MTTKLECEHCGSPETHEQQRLDAYATIVMMMVVAKKSPADWRETIEGVIRDWRAHALPLCNDAAID